MSIATQRAKERKNQTPDVNAIGKTVNQAKMKLGGVVVPLGRGGSTVCGASALVPLGGDGSTAHVEKTLRFGSGRNLGGNG